MTPKGQSQKDARMRREGYDDGYACIPAKRKDAVYQRAWRLGKEARWAHDRLAAEGVEVDSWAGR